MEHQSPLLSRPTKHNPSETQKRFFEHNILGEESTILTLKTASHEQRGFSVNVRGPFRLQRYDFPSHSETVIEPTWAGPQESQSHLHCNWTEVRFAKLSKANAAIRENIGYQWQIAFFATEDDAANDHRLFWFYLENENNKAVQALTEEQIIPIETGDAGAVQVL